MSADEHATPPPSLNDLTPNQLARAGPSIAAAMVEQGVTVAGVGVDWIAPAVADTGWPDGLMRVLSITWPAKDRHLHPAEIKLHQHNTGTQLLAVTKMVLTADCGNAPITAELTMLVDEDGLPIDFDGHGPVVLDETGEPRTGVFQWIVAEMRTAE